MVNKNLSIHQYLIFSIDYRILRKTVGKEAKIAVDANQIWSVPEAIKWMEELAEFDIHWIEEPTSPDDVLGHLEISRALSKYGKYQRSSRRR